MREKVGVADWLQGTTNEMMHDCVGEMVFDEEYSKQSQKLRLRYRRIWVTHLDRRIL